MTLVSQAMFAKMCKKSRKTVTAWKQRGSLVLQGEMVDVVATEARMQVNRRGGSPVVLTVAEVEAEGNKGNKSKRDSNGEVASPHAKIRAGMSSVAQINHDDSGVRDALRVLASAGFEDLPLDEALRRKENYLALLRQLEYEQKSACLVDMDTACSVIFEEFRAARDAWMNWPAKYAPLIAADLGIDAGRVTVVLSEYVHKQLADLGEPEADFNGPSQG